MDDAHETARTNANSLQSGAFISRWKLNPTSTPTFRRTKPRRPARTQARRFLRRYSLLTSPWRSRRRRRSRGRLGGCRSWRRGVPLVDAIAITGGAALGFARQAEHVDLSADRRAASAGQSESKQHEGGFHGFEKRSEHFVAERALAANMWPWSRPLTPLFRLRPPVSTRRGLSSNSWRE
jgi:hypothetical protein